MFYKTVHTSIEDELLHAGFLVEPTHDGLCELSKFLQNAR